LAIHSFTPCLRGRAPRPWHLGILYGTDARLSRALLDLLQNEPDLCTGDNQPYRGQLPNDAIDRHAISANRHNTLIELRNDLITTPTDQTLWATRLAPLLTQALHQAEHLEQEP
jgi:predicted N-formylglutamate amidohydrolase